MLLSVAPSGSGVVAIAAADEETIAPALSFYTGGRQIEEMVNFSRFHRRLSMI